jgi:hypothetical protein
LYADLPNEAKYRTKSIIDTLVWRSGDFIGIWTRGGTSDQRPSSDHHQAAPRLAANGPRCIAIASGSDSLFGLANTAI